MEDEANRLLRETREFLAEATAKEMNRAAEMKAARESFRRLDIIYRVFAYVIAVLLILAAAAWYLKRPGAHRPQGSTPSAHGFSRHSA